MFLTIYVSAALPDTLTNDYQNKITMSYSLNQKYISSESPGQSKYYLSILDYDIVFDNGNWDTELLFKAHYYEGTCGGEYSPTYNFRYLIYNRTREIMKIYQKPDEIYENLAYKHSSYFCGENATNNEYFLLNEFMLLYDKYKEFPFSINGTTSINLEETSYEVVQFNLHTRETEEEG
ncbi:MAG: hypothetical protein ACOC35_03060 [Promethearchaeia archaeon]